MEVTSFVDLPREIQSLIFDEFDDIDRHVFTAVSKAYHPSHCPRSSLVLKFPPPQYSLDEKYYVYALYQEPILPTDVNVFRGKRGRAFAFACAEKGYFKLMALLFRLPATTL